jgi:hypothetical protein
MLKNFDGWKDLTIDFELDPHQRAVLASTVGQEWFDIIQKLFEDEVRKFQVLLANTPAWDEDKIFARHVLAQAAGMIYKGVFSRIAEQVSTQKIMDAGIGTVYNPEQPATMEEFQETPPDTFDN